MCSTCHTLNGRVEEETVKHGDSHRLTDTVAQPDVCEDSSPASVEWVLIAQHVDLLADLVQLN